MPTFTDPNTILEMIRGSKTKEQYEKVLVYVNESLDYLNQNIPLYEKIKVRLNEKLKEAL